MLRRCSDTYKRVSLPVKYFLCILRKMCFSACAGVFTPGRFWHG